MITLFFRSTMHPIVTLMVGRLHTIYKKKKQHSLDYEQKIETTLQFDPFVQRQYWFYENETFFF